MNFLYWLFIRGPRSEDINYLPRAFDPDPGWKAIYATQEGTIKIWKMAHDVAKDTVNMQKSIINNLQEEVKRLREENHNLRGEKYKLNA